MQSKSAKAHGAASLAANPSAARRSRSFWVLLLCLLAVLALLFHKSLLPGYILHNNDNPLGFNAQDGLAMPEGFSGIWMGLNWLGFEGGSLPPCPSWLALWFKGAYGYAKFWQPLSLAFLGLCAWVFLRSARFSGVACVLGGLAFALHADPFSSSCWGQVSRPMALGTMLLALAALNQDVGLRYWLRALLAGAAVGLGIMEGFDVAALYSLVIGAYTVYQAWLNEAGGAAARLVRGLGRLVLVAGFAAVVAAVSLHTLIGVSIQGVSGMEQDRQTKAERWDWATQWSLPKTETLTLLVPGLFGYRMDTPEGGNYWGAMGRDAAWDRYFESGKQGPPPQGFLRYTGGGISSGPVILLLALWAVLQALRGDRSPFGASEKRWIWFWVGLAGVCLLLAWGRFAPFYQLFYALPYASTIRNPTKFLHLTDWAILMLFAYGVQALHLKYWAARTQAAVPGRNWWLQAAPFERKWVVGSVVAMVAAVLGWLVYATASQDLQRYLQEVQFDAATAREIAAFSVKQVGWFVATLAAVLGVMWLVITGRLAGRHARWGGIALGVVLVADLARANLPWIIYWDYRLKYASNDLIDRLKEQPQEGRVVGLPPWFLSLFQLPENVAGPQQTLDQLYRVQWAQHQFQYYNIQSLDVIQLPRPPKDYEAFESALAVRSGDTLPRLTRKWELTNTRYLLALAPFVEVLNRDFDPGKARFRVAESFRLEAMPGITQPRRLEELTAVFTNTGPYALVEFTGALPRAKLYTQWQNVPDDNQVLQQMADPAFDPAQTVLVAEPVDVPAPTPGTNATRVEITRYEPRRVALRTEADRPAVLLLNDRHTPQWQVLVDGTPAPLLRCNYLMRGVQVPAGQHDVEFVFRANTGPLKITLAGLGITLLVGLGLVLTRTKETAPV